MKLDSIEAIHNLSSRKREQLRKLLRAKGVDMLALPVFRRPADLAVIPTSFAQRRMWFLDQLDSGNAAYNVPATVRLVGRLDVDVLNRALNEVVRRHDVLRTRFAVVDDMPVQVVAPTLALELPQTDLSALPQAQRVRQADELAKQEAQIPFDLAAGPLVRGRLLRMAEDEHIMLFTVHHIVSDAWSMGVLAREVAALYAAYEQGEPSPLPPLPIQYADYAYWQRCWLGDEVLQAQVDYWVRQLADAPAVSTLPSERPRPPMQTHRGATLVLRLPANVTAGLHAVALQAQGTLFMVLAAAFNVLLWRHSGQDDLCIGMPVASRTRAELEPLIGLFVNTLVLRTRLHRGATFTELLQQVKATTLHAYAHQDVPFEQLVEVLRPDRNTGYSPLFQVMLVLQNAPVEADEPPELAFEPLGIENTQAKFDLTLNVTEEGEQLKTEFEYSTDLFDAGTIACLAGHFTRLLESVVSDPQQRIGQLQLLDDVERDRMLVQWNGTSTADYPQEYTVHQLFEEQVDRTPEAVAVVFEGASFTYAELNARANRLARHLRGQGAGPDTPVAICVERGVTMVVGLLAILKAGGAYVPLDPDYPAQRLAYMLDDCRPTALLTDAAGAHRLPAQDGVPVVKVDEDEARWHDLPADNLAIETLGLNARHLAYVIYTSGSTGQPKGAMNEHRAVVNRLLWMQHAYGLAPTDAVLQKTPFSFDVSVWEFFWPLLVGARLVLARPQGQRDPNHLLELIDREQITTLHFVPSMLSAFLVSVPVGGAMSLRRIVCSGEALPASMVEAVHRQLPHARLVNLYGPTEAAVDVTAGEPRPGEVVTIGRPIANTRIYILDPEGGTVPLGAPGEIHIGGVQVGRGYLNRPDLTGERFVGDPYASEPGARMYKTGDLGRWRADGTIEFLGRKDDQVKLRGFRIELGEIDARLRQHPDVREAVVHAREDAPGDKRLVAYVMGEQVHPEALRMHLAAHLPEYMVPAAYVQLDAWPLTPNGKLDRKALPAPEADALAQPTYAPPETENERALAAIWSELLALPIERIGRDGDFFALGGHSLLAVRMASQVQQALQRTLPLREIFARRTVRELALHLDALAPTAPLPAIKPVPRDARLPLAPVQERLWVVHQMRGMQTSYNIALALQLQGPLSMPALQAAFEALMLRHEVLRTCFAADADGQPRQLIEPTLSLHIPVLEARCDEVPALVAAHGEQVFGLGRAPLLSVRVLRLHEREHVLLLNMHHIISDGWSMNVLAHDMRQLYLAQLQGRPAELPALSVQYADYAHWLCQQDMSAHAAYWAQALHGYEPGLTLPLDRPAQPRPSSARTLTLEYPVELCASLSSFCMQHSATLFMALTAALGVVLQRYTGRRDLCVGTTVAGRDRAELEPLIGFFVNIVALRLDLSGDPSASELLERVKRTLLPALEHQALPFEQVLQMLKLSGGSAQELVPVMVRHQNVPDTVGSQWSDGLTVELLPGLEQSAKCPLDLQFFGDAQGLYATVEYAADLFDEATVRRLLQHHQQVLKHMVQHPQQPMSLLPLLTAQERQLIGQGNLTARELDDALSLVALFEQQVQASPDACACLDEQGQRSYAELNVRANRIAHALRERGVGPEVRVGLYMPRSCDFIAAMLGIFKAGGVYVPLDTNAPPAYLQRLIDDAKPHLVMHGLQPPAAACPGIELLGVAEAALQGPESNLPVPWHAQQLAMLAYTSGSTGLPKGVLVPHGQLLNLLRSMQARLPLGPEDVVAQKTMAPFVVSMKELLGALLAGVPQVVVGDALLKDPPGFIAALQRGRVSRLFIVPSHLQAVLDALEDPAVLSNLRMCVTAGEPLSQRLRERVQSTLPWVALWNNFGCTELNDTAYCDPARLGGAGQFVPIGWPIDNVQVHVLDERLRELPLGVAGELCVHYPWMARGYWRQPDLTAERFVPNPYGPPGSRLYRTGDIVRRLADGSLEYLGREDFDVKIRGQRVDVRQVEAALAGCEGVHLAAAGAWCDDRGDTHLVAYVVPRSGRPLQAASLRRQLVAQLPAFMVPGMYVALQALPRTTTGKLDRKSLPAPHVDALAQQPYVPPETHTERALAHIWSRFLELPVERIGRDDDFFALGGHSLLATRVASRVQQALMRPLQLHDVFSHGSLRELAAHVDSLATSELPPPIEPRGHQGDVELSFAQQRLWFLHQWEPDSSAYHITLAVRVHASLEESLVERTLQTLVRRHEALRTTFPDIDGHPLQRVAEHAKVLIESIDLSALDAVQREAQAQEASRSIAARAFDLARGPLLRLQLVRLGSEETLLTLVVHHIVADGWSMDLLVKELLALYDAFSKGQPDPLPPPAIHYPDYAVWQRRYLQGEVLRQQERYWTGKLAGAPALLALPTDRSRPAVQTYRGLTVRRWIGGELAERLHRFAKGRQVTPFMVLLTAYNALLWRYSGQSDIVVGTPVANRHHPGLELLVGMLANTLALRSQVESGQTFADLLAQIRETTLEAQAHQDLPLDHLVERLQVPRSTSHAPLFQVMFSLLSLTAQREEENQVDWDVYETPREASQCDLILKLEESPEGFSAKWEFDTDLFDIATIERMARQFEGMLQHAVTEPQTELGRLPMLDEQERDEILHRFNDTAVAYEPRCLHHLFEAQVRRSPDAPAVTFEGRVLTYAELNGQTNRLAHHLIDLGVRPDSRVAIALPRGIEMVVAMLATLKAGGAYLPLDLDYPAERLAAMLADSRPVALLTDAAGTECLPALPVIPVCVLDQDDPPWSRLSAGDPPAAALGLMPHHLAYVIYTSGSTGQPKGVMVEHRAIANYVTHAAQHFDVAGGEGSLALTTFSFDLALTSVYPPLICGRPLRLCAAGNDVSAWQRELGQAHALAPVKLTPSHLALLQEGLAAADVQGRIRALVLGGEPLKGAMLEWWRQNAPGTRIFNHYGPTEATVGCVVHEVVELQADIPIGRPISNMRIYLLDPHGQLVPRGVPGEIHIGGIGVARGYLNRPHLTAECFVPDPHAAEPGARMYRSGDLARWRSDGTIQYLGRKDHQVKLRGFRIELGEIEAALLAYPGVREAVALVREDSPGDARLAAYFTGDEALPLDALRNHLAARLPEYMVPTAYVQLAALPLTPNGKIDRTALPAPEGAALGVRTYEAPLGEVEMTIAALWRDLLGTERIGRHDNFFALGGHSLLAIKLFDRMRKAGLPIDVRELFARPTVQALAQAVYPEDDVEVPPNGIPDDCEAITPDMLPLIQLTPDHIARIVSTVPGGAANVQDIYPLSPLQEGILFQHLIRQEKGDYLSTTMLNFETRDGLDAFLDGMQAVVDRHDILRTSVLWDGLPEPVQVVWRRARLTIEEMIPSADGGDTEEQLRSRYGLHDYWMDVRKAPLVRTVVARDAIGGGWKLLIDEHLLIGDAESYKTIAREIQAILEGQADDLPPALPFRNYIAQTRLRVSREEHEAFFRKMLSHVDEPTAPFGLLNVQQERVDVRVALTRLPDELSSRLRQHGRSLGVSAASLFHLAWARVVSKLSGREEVVFGTFMFGRMQGGAGADRTPGSFINIVPVAIRIGEKGVARSVHETQALLAQLLRHEHAPLPLALRCSAVRPPELLFSALLNYRHGDAMKIEELQGPEVIERDERAYYPFTLDVDDVGNEFYLTARMNSKIDPQRIFAYVGATLSQLADALERDPETPVMSLDILPADERRQLIEEWNDNALPLAATLSIQQLFEAQAHSLPHRVAVEHEGQQLSYAELNRRANRLAHHLRTLGVGPDASVAICMERSIDMIVGLLAILKAGGAYVPLDPGYPPERLSYIVNDSRPVVMLLSPSTAACARPVAKNLPVVDIINDAPHWMAAPDDEPQAGVVSSNLVYVIYTSGSTGTPKGVMVEQAGLVNRIVGLIDRYRFTRDDRVLQFATYTFDASVEEFFCTLCSGATLVLRSDSWIDSAAAFWRRCADAAITVVDLPTRFLQHVVEPSATAIPSSVRLVIVGGEELPTAVQQRWSDGPGCPLLNTYGPTEAIVVATAHEVEPGGVAGSIGHPVPHARVYVLDYGVPVPLGVAGEIHVGGAALARGYVNRPGLTAERFVPDPFSAEPGARMYKTGDLGRWRADGTIEYLGRNDQQIKIRGFRVELGEVEAAFAALPWVREALVTVRDDPSGSRELVTYVVPLPGTEVPPARQVRESLARTLPRYMVPARIVCLERLPLMPNGKVDLQALPAPDGGGLDEAGYAGPRTELEELLCGIWAEVLKIERVGVHDSFFDLGGHSLLALQVISQLSRRLGREVPVHLLFASRTVAALAREIGDPDASEEFRNLVAIRTSGSRPPLFIIHAGDGEVGYAFELAPHLPPDRPLYALAAIGFAEGEMPLPDVQAMAASYVRAMRGVQAHGPYHVLGWSAGGTIACEIAEQLLAAGEQVGFIGVIDTLRDYSAKNRSQVSTEAQFLVNSVREELDGDFADQLAALAERNDIDAMFDLCQGQGVIPATIERITLRRHLAVRYAIGLAVASYRAQPIAVPLTVFTAADEDRPDPRLGWDEIAEHGLEVVELPGTHWSIVDPAHSRALGKAISEALAARSRGGLANRDAESAASVF